MVWRLVGEGTITIDEVTLTFAAFE